QRCVPRSWVVTPGSCPRSSRSRSPSGAGAVADGVKAQLKGLLHRGAEADDVDVAVLPGFEAAGAVSPGEAASAVPCGGADLGDERVESLQGGVTDPEEAGSA